MWVGIAILLSLGQVTSPDPSPWAQLGIASIVCALLFTGLWLLWSDNKNLRETVARLQEDRLRDRDGQVQRERELADRLAPLLSQAADVLARVPAQFDRALSEATRAAGKSELEVVLQRLESATTQLQNRSGD